MTPTLTIRDTILKNTKGTGPLFIARPLQGLVPRPFTEKLSEGFANTSRGHRSEDRVERVFEERGYRTIRRRWRTPFAELDLVLATPDGKILIVEVKTSDWPEGALAGLSRQQWGRLLRAREWLADCEGQDVELWVVTFDAGYRLRINSMF